MKTLEVNTKFIWKIIKTDIGYNAICDRLGLNVSSTKLNELFDLMRESINLELITAYHNNSLDKFCFNHSIEYRLKESNDFVTISPSTILLKE